MLSPQSLFHLVLKISPLIIKTRYHLQSRAKKQKNKPKQNKNPREECLKSNTNYVLTYFLGHFYHAHFPVFNGKQAL